MKWKSFVSFTTPEISITLFRRIEGAGFHLSLTGWDCRPADRDQQSARRRGLASVTIVPVATEQASPRAHIKSEPPQGRS